RTTIRFDDTEIGEYAPIRSQHYRRCIAASWHCVCLFRVKGGGTNHVIVASEVTPTPEAPEQAPPLRLRAISGNRIAWIAKLASKEFVLPLRHPVAVEHTENDGKQQCADDDRLLGAVAAGRV